MSELTDKQREAITGLRDFANHLESNPELIDLIAHETFYIFHRDNDVSEFARKALMLGTSDKSSIGDWFNVHRNFGPMITLQVTARHDDVCERVVIDTETVEIEEYDKELAAAALENVPLVKTSKVIEKIEWKCPPSLLEAARVR